MWLSKSKIGFRIRFCTPKVGKYIIYPLFCRFTVFGHLGMGISVLNFHEKRLHRISKFWAEILHVILYHGLEPTWKVTDGSDENKDFRGLRDRPNGWWYLIGDNHNIYWWILLCLVPFSRKIKMLKVDIK